MSRMYFGLPLGLLLLAGCATPPADMQTLQARNTQLESQLTQANQQITALETDKRQLEKELTRLQGIMQVLETEKGVRVQESSKLRGEVRQFVQQQVDNLKAFLLDADLLDYVGAELVSRQQLDPKPRLLVDLGNPIPRDGTLTGVTGYFEQTGPMSVKVLRPVEDRLVVIWQSSPLQVNAPGLQRINFPVGVGVERGDVIGYQFPQAVLVGFDEGTGDTRYTSDDVQLGATLRRSSLDGEREQRAYSLGVYGLLN